jgi:predicted ATP-grasp superfamily ATP-dependent carboligase
MNQYETAQPGNSAEECRVLILDGETRTALAVVRSLGAAGYSAAVASHEPRAIALASKWNEFNFRCPCPATQPDRFIHWLSRTIELWQPWCVLPLTDVSLGLVLKFEETFRESAVIPTIDRQTFEAVSDKGALAQVAASLGIAVPKTVAVTSLTSRERLEELLDSYHYPVVVKPSHSVVQNGNKSSKPDVCYANSLEQVASIVVEETERAEGPIEFLVQEKIQGSGVGVFALCVRGEILVDFAHRRILEKPPSGGRSVLSESISPEEAPFEAARALLKHYAWTGVAMVEFKQSESGVHYLMEINPRFWGSLQLAIDCDRDFPKYLVDLSRRSPSTAELERFRNSLMPYKTHQRLRWELGTLDHFLIRLKAAPRQTLKAVFREDALGFRTKYVSTRTEVCRLDDLKPFFRECTQYVLDLLRISR